MMSREIVNKYEKIDKILIKMIIVLFIFLILTQWYLRNEKRGIESFLNRVYSNEDLKFQIINVIPEKTSENNVN